jgi:hypothetical protein
MRHVHKVLYEHWDVVAMYLALAVVLFFEFLGVFNKQYITITAIVRQHVPLWLRRGIWGLLGGHFLLK